MTATIEHSAEGTLVHGTTPGDSATIEVLNVNGFRWSAGSRPGTCHGTLRPEIRDTMARAVTRALGDAVRLEQPDGGARQSAAEKDAARRDQAADRADRMIARAELKQAESDVACDAAHQATAGSPLGQPIRFGHHSQGRHERALERSCSQREARSDKQTAPHAAAERAARTASGDESVVTIEHRINRNQAELRRLDRLLAGTASPGHGPVSREYAEQLRERREQLVDQIGFDEAKLAAAGGITYGKHNVTATGAVFRSPAVVGLRRIAERVEGGVEPLLPAAVGLVIGFGGHEPEQVV